MGYAVVGYFDKDADERIKSLWQGMADSNVCDYLIRSDNNPHIKFAMFNELDIGFAKEILKSLARRVGKVSAHFKTYSFYPNEEPFICIDVAVSMPLLELQSSIQLAFEKHTANDTQSFFTHGIWKPDCQLTRGFSKSRLADAVDYLSKTQLPFDGTIERLGLIEFHPAKQLFSYELA